MPRVSVVMPVYNGSKYLRESLMSVINQTYKDWECIIYDDNSSDDSAAIINSIIKENDQFIYLHSDQNVGAAEARNKCINVARGEYIAILDCDDIAFEDRFSQQVDFLDQNSQYDFVGSNVIYFGEGLKSYESTYKPFEIKNVSFRSGMPIVHSTLMIKKSLIVEVGKYPNFRRVQDYAMLMNVSANGSIGYLLQPVMVKYRIDEGNYKRRTIKSRIIEVKIRLQGYKKMNYPLNHYLYAFKPLLSAVIPTSAMKWYHQKNKRC